MNCLGCEVVTFSTFMAFESKLDAFNYGTLCIKVPSDFVRPVEDNFFFFFGVECDFLLFQKVEVVTKQRLPSLFFFFFFFFWYFELKELRDQ